MVHHLVSTPQIYHILAVFLSTDMRSCHFASEIVRIRAITNHYSGHYYKNHPRDLGIKEGSSDLPSSLHIIQLKYPILGHLDLFLARGHASNRTGFLYTGLR